jgi:ADP-ribosylglycohydrolase
MRDTETTVQDQERHEAVYATAGLPAFAVHELDDRLLAGRNPLTVVDVARLRRLNVSHVLDLREEKEWRPPGRFGAEAVAAMGPRGIERRNVVVRDVSPPSPKALDEAVAWIDGVVARPGTRVFVHCRAGRERTGSVLAAYFVSHGTSLEAALAFLRERCGAEPLPAQMTAVRAWVAKRAERHAAMQRDRILGCFLGGAVGDALGAPVEFASLAEIRRKFGPAGVTGFTAAYGRLGAITDDTQMTLFTAEGLIRAQQRLLSKGICDPPSVVRMAYLRWLDTQGEAAGVKDAEYALHPEGRGWLVDEAVLRHRRAPGHTCLSGLRSGRHGLRTERLNDSKGCGGVMRVAPVGLIASDPFGLGSDLAALTHGHPSGFLAAGAFAVAIDAVAKGSMLRDAVAAARLAVAGDPEGGEVTTAIDRAIAVATAGTATPEDLETLGGGWVAEEALAIAFYCVLVEPDPRRALLLAVNHSGDSDSTGSMVGQLLGAAHGLAAIPAEWVAAVEGREVIERLAEDFAKRFVDNRELDWAQYPGG